MSTAPEWFVQCGFWGPVLGILDRPRRLLLNHCLDTEPDFRVVQSLLVFSGPAGGAVWLEEGRHCDGLYEWLRPCPVRLRHLPRLLVLLVYRGGRYALITTDRGHVMLTG